MVTFATTVTQVDQVDGKVADETIDGRNRKLIQRYIT